MIEIFAIEKSRGKNHSRIKLAPKVKLKLTP